MVRQRKSHEQSAVRRRQSERTAGFPASSDDEGVPRKKSALARTLTSAALTTVVLLVCVFLYLGYLETRVNTPFSAPKVVSAPGLADPDRYWGTYRPGVYFGTRVRHPLSPVTGLMWFTLGHFQNNMLALRHWCDQGDALPSYGWQEHDGRAYGRQTVNDTYADVTTTYVKRPGGAYGGDWTVRVAATPKPSVRPQQPRLASLIYYVALDPSDDTASLHPLPSASPHGGVIMGSAKALGGFRLHVLQRSGVVHRTHFLNTRHLGLNQLKETVFRGLRHFKGEADTFPDIGLVGDVFAANETAMDSNFIAIQITAELPFEIDVVYESDSFTQRPSMFAGEVFTQDATHYSKRFNEDFEAKFPLKEYGEKEKKFAKAALSNMVGGIGYFYGASKVQGGPDKEPVPYWKAPLYTAVPSRSFFPRGFLWDEGFHNLLISKWDREISMDIIAHWMDLMNWDGWIPREQILGVEARDRVPAEFVVQRSENANPPTLLLTLHSMMGGFQTHLSDHEYDYLKRMWPRLKAWYSWFNTTQTGPLDGSYRWRGRDPLAERELNPKTLTSGLDDYPRASHPDDTERHLDLRCWMALASQLMADVATVIEQDPSRYLSTATRLSDNRLLDSLHWSPGSQGYMDYGSNTFDVKLARHRVRSSNQHHGYEVRRVVGADKPKAGFVDTFGYVSFFPLFMQLIDANSPKLGKVLDDLERTDLLWTEFGLRSLAKNSPLYMKKNTEHDAPYWRGPIWINMNYLAVRSLHHYSTIAGPHATKARNIYSRLRSNLVRNIVSQYYATGYVWEQYNDSTGKGQGCRPFTGWSALVVLMMSESY